MVLLGNILLRQHRAQITCGAPREDGRCAVTKVTEPAKRPILPKRQSNNLSSDPIF